MPDADGEAVPAPRSSPAGTAARRRAGAARLAGPLSDPRVIWAIDGVLLLRLLVVNLTTGVALRVDGLNFLRGGSDWISNPSHLYAGVAPYLSQFHYQPHEAFLNPPAAAVLAAPFSLLPEPWAVVSWTIADCVCLAAALVVWERALRPRGVLRAWFWAVILYFPPLFAETIASQISGFVLLASVGAIVLAARSRVAAGVAAGVGTALKVYPALLLLAIRPARWGRYLAGLGIGAVLALAAGFARPGVGNPVTYVTGILLPLSRYPPLHDCAVVSVPSMWERLFGGVFYYDAAGGAVHQVSLWSVGWLATAFEVTSVVVLTGAAVWAAWRSGWEPLYSGSALLALAALLPGDVHTYQVLPLLPLVLLTVVRRYHSPLTVAAILVGLVGVVQQPCDLPFPNVWTFAMLLLFGAGIAQAPAMREAPSLTR